LLGTRFFADGNIYLGEWKKGVREGWGKMIYFKGMKFEGNFKYQ
jgi:hypothetical protein